MKNAIVVVLAMGLMMLAGCAEQKPEDAARRIVDQQVAVHHEGFELDTSGLGYTVITRDDTRATVEVSGTIPVKAVIPLAMKGGEWVLDVPAAKPVKGTAPAH